MQVQVWAKRHRFRCSWLSR